VRALESERAALLGVSMGFTNYLVDAENSCAGCGVATHSIHSPMLFLLMLNLFLVVAGCLMEIIPHRRGVPLARSHWRPRSD